MFGEKYGDQVRVVNVPGFSRELCGGTHVGRTGDIGVCKIVYEGSISAGVRRIEAVTGEGALRQYQESVDAIKRIANLLKAGEPEVIEHVEKLLAAERAQARQVDQLKSKLAQSASGTLESQARRVNGSTVLAARIDGMDRGQLRELADSFRNAVEERRCSAGIGGRRWRFRSGRGHQRSYGQSPCRKAGWRGGASRGRKGRRPSGYGGRRRQRPIGD